MVGIINNALDALRFKDTIFYKDNSDLEAKYEALIKLKEEYPHNEKILNELFMVKKGLAGEKEIAYQLKKAHIGMYVLRDVLIKYEDLTAQIDFVVITPIYTYFIECKNLMGNITVDEKGDFIKEITLNGKKIKKGMYSPLRQVEAQREVVRKVWERESSVLKKVLASKNFNYYHPVLVVVANQEALVNTYRAPKEIKNKIIRADALIRKITTDLANSHKEHLESKKGMEEIAQSFANLAINNNVNYYDFYKKKYSEKEIFDNLKERLLNLRKQRSKEMNLPAYYIFNNEELDMLLKLRPHKIEDLQHAKILPPIKVKMHGAKIIDEINKSNF